MFNVRCQISAKINTVTVYLQLCTDILNYTICIVTNTCTVYQYNIVYRYDQFYLNLKHFIKLYNIVFLKIPECILYNFRKQYDVTIFIIDKCSIKIVLNIFNYFNSHTYRSTGNRHCKWNRSSRPCTWRVSDSRRWPEWEPWPSCSRGESLNRDREQHETSQK